ncbi:MAG: nitroreductase family protein [Desulfovibrio sp.]
MIEFHVDQERCVQCGECVVDCPMKVLTMNTGFPAIIPEKESFCINCQHCLAICPTEALSIHGCRPEESRPLKGALPSRQQLETLIMGRRSVRRYTDKPVDKDEIEQLMRVVAHAPSGRNNADRLFSLVDDANVMEQYRKLTYHGLDLAAKNNQIPESLGFFARFPEAFAQGNDVIFRGAPHLFAVSSPGHGASAEADCLIALSYFELLASSAGLGALWCGLAKWAMGIVPEMRLALGIPEGHVLGYVMLFGHPDVRYQRTVQRNPAHILRLKFKS